MARRPKSRQVEQAERKGEKTPRIRGLGSRWNAVDADHRKWTLVITSRVGERCSPGPPEKGSAHLRSLGVLRDRRLRLRLVRRRLLAMQEANADGGHELGLSRLANRWSGLAPNPLHPCEAQRTSISASSFGPTSSILNAVEMASLNSLTTVYSSTSAPPPLDFARKPTVVGFCVACSAIFVRSVARSSKNMDCSFMTDSGYTRAQPRSPVARVSRSCSRKSAAHAPSSTTGSPSAGQAR